MVSKALGLYNGTLSRPDCTSWGTSLVVFRFSIAITVYRMHVAQAFSPDHATNKTDNIRISKQYFIVKIFFSPFRDEVVSILNYREKFNLIFFFYLILKKL